MKIEGKPVGIIGILVDDTLGCGNDGFIKFEEISSKKFDVKERDTTLPMKFGGITIGKANGVLSANQINYGNTFKCLDLSRFTPKDFSHLRGQIGYIASGTRPDVGFNYAFLSQVKADEATKSDAQELNSSVKKIQKSKLGILLYPN